MRRAKSLLERRFMLQLAQWFMVSMKTPRMQLTKWPKTLKLKLPNGRSIVDEECTMTTQTLITLMNVTRNSTKSWSVFIMSTPKTSKTIWREELLFEDLFTVFKINHVGLESKREQ